MEIERLSEEYQRLFYEGAKAIKAKAWDKVLEVFTKILDAYPDFVPALEGRSTAKLHKEDFEGAQADLEAALKLEPNNPRLYYRLGQISFRKKNLDEAMELFTKAIDLEPLYPAAYMARSQILREKGLEEVADLELQKAINVSKQIAISRKVVDFV